MKIIESVTEMQNQRQAWHKQDLTVGFVPTMGALHPGHMTLVQRAQAECDIVCVSLFVNPTQFNDPGDLARYPKPREQDVALLRAADVGVVFVPNTQEIYADNFRYSVQESAVTKILCGPQRPGHFTGVLTVVLRLLNIVGPARAYFGEKDYQQLRLIQDMAQALFLPTVIIGCPTMREEDGLAMSSRNLLLTPAQRTQAAALYRVLRTARSAVAAKQELTHLGFRVDYVEEHWGRRFAAAFLGDVRLIDNVEM